MVPVLFRSMSTEWEYCLGETRVPVGSTLKPAEDTVADRVALGWEPMSTSSHSWLQADYDQRTNQHWQSVQMQVVVLFRRPITPG